MLLDSYDFYDKMEHTHSMLSFKGDLTSGLLTSILQIMEYKLDNLQEEPTIKKKMYIVLVESLQNLYHHMDEAASEQNDEVRSAICMIGKVNNQYTITTGNYIKLENVELLKNRLEKINLLSKKELKNYYNVVLKNGETSMKGGSGLGLIDMARKTGEKINFNFVPIDRNVAFFSLTIKISQ